MNKISQKEQDKRFAKILNKRENIYCADCESNNPRWVSIDFGVIICMNCSGNYNSF